MSKLVSSIESVNSFGLKPFTCVNSFSPVVNSVHSFFILYTRLIYSFVLIRKPFTPFTTPVKTLHKTLHNCSQPFTLWLIRGCQKKTSKPLKCLDELPQNGGLTNHRFFPVEIVNYDMIMTFRGIYWM